MHPDGDTAVDDALLAALASNGRASYESLARELDLPRALVRTRVQRLLSGDLAEVVGVVHPAVLGLDATAHVLVHALGPARPVADAIAAIEDVSLVSLTIGRAPIVAEIRTGDTQALAATVRRIGRIDGVGEVSTSTYVELLRDANVPPRPYSPVPVDATDLALLALLQHDGRAAFADLAAGVGLSTGAARARVLRMVDAGVVHIGLRLRPSLSTVAQTGIGIRLRGDAPDVVRRVLDLTDVAFLATALGNWDLVGTLHTPRPAAVHDTLEALRTIEGVQGLESWRHLHFVKNSYLRTADRFDGPTPTPPSPHRSPRATAEPTPPRDA